MVVNGVTFIEREVKKLSEKEFIRICVGLYWQDESKRTRISRLKYVFNLINGGGEG